MIRDSLMSRVSGQRQRELHCGSPTRSRAAGTPTKARSSSTSWPQVTRPVRAAVLFAAKAAERSLAFLRAAELYWKAIELEVPHPRWQLERSVGDALLSAGHAAEAAATFVQRRAARPAPNARRCAAARPSTT